MPSARTTRRIRDLHEQGCTLQEIVQVTHVNARIIRDVLCTPEHNQFNKPAQPDFIEPPQLF